MPRLWIPGPLPGLNEIIDARARANGKWNGYAVMKKSMGVKVALFANAARLEKIGPSHFSYFFIEPNKRRDPSNFIAGGIKIIEDGLQEAGLLDNDGWKHVLSIRTRWSVGPQPGVEVTIEERKNVGEGREEGEKQGVGSAARDQPHATVRPAARRAR